MNARQQQQRRKDNWHLYHIPSQANYKTLKINALFTSKAKDESEEKHRLHEHGKLAVCTAIKRLGHDFITEAAKNKKEADGLERRVDVVDLDTGREYEIETQADRAARFELMTSKKLTVILVEDLSLEEAILKCEKAVEDVS